MPIQQLMLGGGGKGPANGASAASPGTSAKQIYDDGYVTSGKMIRWIDFGGSVGVKQVWCDFDTDDADGNSGWMLFISLIPLIGPIWLFILYVKNSQPGENKWGPNPKGN